MKKEQYCEINNDILKVAYRAARSIENMAAHVEEERNVTYKGSTQKGELVTDYYEDNTGSFWYQKRGIRNGHIVSIDMYIFGKEVKKSKRKS